MGLTSILVLDWNNCCKCYKISPFAQGTAHKGSCEVHARAGKGHLAKPQMCKSSHGLASVRAGSSYTRCGPLLSCLGWCSFEVAEGGAGPLDGSARMAAKCSGARQCLPANVSPGKARKERQLSGQRPTWRIQEAGLQTMAIVQGRRCTAASSCGLIGNTAGGRLCIPTNSTEGSQFQGRVKQKKGEAERGPSERVWRRLGYGSWSSAVDD